MVLSHLKDDSYRNQSHSDSLNEAVKLTHPTVIDLKEGSYYQKTRGDSLNKCIKHQKTLGDRN
jgi:hypothetical protein